MAQNLILTAYNEDDIMIFDMEGDITSTSNMIIIEHIEKALNQNYLKFIINFEKASYINSAGLALLIQAIVKIHDIKGNTAICNVNEHYTKIFQIVGLDKYVNMYNTLEEALNGF